MCIVHVFHLHACLDTTYVSPVLGSQKRTSDSQELEIQMVVNGHVGAMTQTQDFWKGQCS